MKDIEFLLLEYGPLLVFLNVLLEQAGLPIPAYPLLIVAGALAVHGNLPWELTLAAAVVACLIADAAWYAGGKRFGSGLLNTVCRVSISRDSCIRQTQSLYWRTGPRILFVAKFLPGASALSTVMSGYAGLPFRRFLAYDAGGSLIWAGSALIVGAAFNDMVGDVIAVLGEYGGYGLLAIAVMLACYLGYRWVRRKRTIRRFAHVRRVTLDELDEMQAQGCVPVLLDVRASSDDPMPGAIAFDPHAPIGQQEQAWPVDAHIVVYCACPEEISAAVLADRLLKAGYRNACALAGGYNAWLARRQAEAALAMGAVGTAGAAAAAPARASGS
ncbi:Rhodanese domain-containing protein [Bordetella sputigena]|uniref:VTT domain-containing protein n=1 Tax=Bordetella sputigena TaxID=1416810 RepID=UPI0039EFC4F5